MAYIEFKLVQKKPKTNVYEILAKSDQSMIGTVSWYAPWGQYCFLDLADVVWTRRCLTDIVDFLEELMQERSPKPVEKPTARPDNIQEFLGRLYEERLKAERVMVSFTPLELEQLNVLIHLGASARKSSLMKDARKERRRLNKWERHLLRADRNLWKKMREAEKTAFGSIDHA